MTGRAIAVFDFDGTLVKGDSLWPFLCEAAGTWRSCAVLGAAVARRAIERPQGDDGRTYIKAYLLKELLGGRRVEALLPVVDRMRAWPTWLEATLGKLKEHRAAGHHIVIASGSLDLYLKVLLKNVPYDALLCTEMEVKDGIVTGLMSSGNCVRKRKAELVAGYLKANGPFDDSYGYGNAPHDLPMLALMKHRIIV